MYLHWLCPFVSRCSNSLWFCFGLQAMDDDMTVKEDPNLGLCLPQELRNENTWEAHFPCFKLGWFETKFYECMIPFQQKIHCMKLNFRRVPQVFFWAFSVIWIVIYWPNNSRNVWAVVLTISLELKLPFSRLRNCLLVIIIGTEMCQGFFYKLRISLGKSN